MRKVETNRKNHFIQFIIGFIFTFALLSPTSNFLVKEISFGKFFINLLIGFLLIILFSFYRLTIHGLYIILFSILLAVLTLNPYAFLKNVSFFFFIFIFSNQYDETFKKITLFVFYINALFIVGQLLGLGEWFYKFQDYSNDAEATIGEFDIGSSIDMVFGYLPQIRPSGFFPAPTYISNFCIFFWYYIIMNKNFHAKWVFFLFGFVLMLLGSTLALFLLLVSFFLVKYKKEVWILLIGGVFGACFYIYYFPLTFNYNFNVEEFISSFTVRLFKTGDNEESILVSNPILFFFLVFLVIAGSFILRRVGSISIIFKSTIVVILPLMIHEALSSIQYWVTVSFFVSDVLSKEQINLAQFKRRSTQQVS